MLKDADTCTNRTFPAALPKPKEDGSAGAGEGVPLPQTLVRVPTQQAALLPQPSSGSAVD
jgi:DASH complex subunit DAD2